MSATSAQDCSMCSSHRGDKGDTGGGGGVKHDVKTHTGSAHAGRFIHTHAQAQRHRCAAFACARLPVDIPFRLQEACQNAFSPRGPRVTATASASWSMPRWILLRASMSKLSFLASARTPRCTVRTPATLRALTFAPEKAWRTRPWNV